jgi:hypothetical protein
MDSDSNRAVHGSWAPAPYILAKPAWRKIALSIAWFQEIPSNVRRTT